MMQFHKLFVFILALTIILLVCSCQIKLAEKGNLFSAQPECNKISMRDYDITILDKRQFVDHRKLKVPLMSTPGMMDRISPEIDLNLRRIFGEILEQCRTKGDRSFLFTVEILDIVEEFSADQFSETEYVSISLKVSVEDQATGEMIQSNEGEVWGSRQTTHSTLEEIEKMVTDSLKLAFMDALSKLKLQ